MNVLLKNEAVEPLAKKNTISFRFLIYIIYGTYLLNTLLMPGLFFIGIALSYFLLRYKTIPIVERSHLIFTLKLFKECLLWPAVLLGAPYLHIYITGNYAMAPMGPILAMVAFMPMPIWFIIMTMYALVRLFLNKEMNRYHCYSSSVLFLVVYILSGAWLDFFILFDPYSK